jgi:hypothetical protein
MNKLLFFCVLITFNHFSLNAQDYEGRAFDIRDRLIESRPFELYNTQSKTEALLDSIIFSLVKTDIDTTLAREFTYPKWFLHNNSPLDSSKAPLLTSTSSTLMNLNYNIQQGGPGNGCMWQPPFYIYDSLMNDAIINKYGKNVFKTIRVKADSLDRLGLGLTLPYIKPQSKTNSILRKAFSFVYQLPYHEGEKEEDRFISFEFKSEKISKVFLYTKRLFIQQDLRNMDLSDKLKKLAQNLNWSPPKFLGKPIDKRIIWKIENGDMWFQED